MLPVKYGINFTATIETFVWAVKQAWYYNTNMITTQINMITNRLEDIMKLIINMTTQ